MEQDRRNDDEEQQNLNQVQSDGLQRIEMLRQREEVLRIELEKALRGFHEQKGTQNKGRTLLEMTVAELSEKIIENESRPVQLRGSGGDTSANNHQVEINAEIEPINLVIHTPETISQLREEKRELTDAYRNAKEEIMMLQMELNAYKRRTAGFAPVRAELSEKTEALARALRKIESLNVERYNLDKVQSYIRMELSLALSAVRQWESLALSRGVQCPNGLGYLINQMQNNEAAAITEKNRAIAEIQKLSEELSVAHYERNVNAAIGTHADTLRKNQESLIFRLQKRHELITMERDTYRQQVEAYEMELSQAMMRNPEAHGVNAIFRSRVQSLEETLEHYRRVIETLEVEEAQTPNGPIPAAFLHFVKENTEMKRVVSRLWSRCLELEMAAEAQSRINQQQQFLQSRPSMNYMPGTSGSPMPSTSSAPTSFAPIYAPTSYTPAASFGPIGENVVCDFDQLEAFMDEYRQVCATLFGYKIYKVGSNTYRIASIFSKSDSEYLIFVTNGGAIRLMINEFSESLAHLNPVVSLPSFMSRLTLDMIMRANADTDNDEYCNVVDVEDDDDYTEDDEELPEYEGRIDDEMYSPE